MHRGTTAGTTGLNKSFEKSGLKVNKKGGATHAKHGYHNLYIYKISDRRENVNSVALEVRTAKLVRVSFVVIVIIEPAET